MIESSQDNQARFVHNLTSPLTAMRGAVDLLRHPRRLGDDPVTRDLIDTLERNIQRLGGYIEILLRHQAMHGQLVQITVPIEAFDSEQLRSLEALRLPLPVAAPFQPLDSSHMDLPKEKQPTARKAPANSTILLIGQRIGMAAGLLAALADAGYHILKAETGTEGIDIAREQRPDIVLIDIDLPVISAPHVMKVLREDPDTKTIPIVLAVPTAVPGEAQAGRVELISLRDSPLLIVSKINQVIEAARSIDAQTPTLLIVDDDADIQRILMLRMQQDGYRVVQAMNGAEALMAAQKQSFDLIILDLLLPDIDGFSILGALRARNATATTPILLLSARDSAPEKVRGLQLGADDYVTKPFSPAELQARVRAALRRYEREAGANPSTRLPGNVAIERALRRRIEQNLPFAVCYADIDNFKAYNDTYSFLKGDAVIHQTANLLLEAVAQQGNYDDFVGHIGGDDFVVITTPDRAEPIAAHTIRNFDLLSPLFYDPATRKIGYIDAADRQGRPTRYPFMSLSIGVVSTERHPIRHVAEVAQRSVEPKKRAKETLGSNYVIED